MEWRTFSIGDGDGAVLVRPPARDDLEAIFAIHGDPPTNDHNPAGYWSVCSLGDGEVIGVAGVRLVGAGRTELFNLYCRLAVSAWGRGIAGRVARAAISFANEGWPARPVIARMQAGYVASEPTALRAGLVRVGRDPWGRTVLADRPVDPERLAALPPASRG